MKERRQVGFIKTFSSKQISYHHDEPSEFSYFKMKGNRHEDQFSPYRIQNYDIQPKEVLAKPPLPKPKAEHPFKKYQTEKNIVSSKTSIQGKEQAKNILQRAKQNVLLLEDNKKTSKEKLDKNIGNIRNKINELDAQLKHLQVSKEKKRRESEQKLRQLNSFKSKKNFIESSEKSSSSSSEQNEEEKPIPAQKGNKNQPTSIHQYRYNYHIDFSSTKKPSLSRHNQQESQESPKQVCTQNFITFNSRTTNKPPLVIQQYSSQSSQEQNQQFLYMQQTRQEAKNVGQKNVAQKEYEVDIEQVDKKKEVYRNKGGVCFDIDVKQFTEPIIQSNREEKITKRQKPQKIDKKAQMLKRREQAKLYDKIARKAVFNTYK